MKIHRTVSGRALLPGTAATVLALACSLGSWQTSATDAKPKTSWPTYDGQETIAAYARRVGLETTRTLDLGGGVKMEFVLVPPGSFLMGGTRRSTWEGQGNEGPIHKVTITKPFYIGKYEVTVAQFAAFANATKYQTDCEKAGHKGGGVKDGRWGMQSGVNWRNPGVAQTPDHPVVLVSWNDARAFAAWVSRQTGKDVRLPTEAQWEYAARGPKSLEYPFGASWDGRKANHGDAALKASGWSFGCTRDNDGFAHTAPVGKFDNASWCGALDMAGNVWERVQDWEANYTAEAQVDPQGPGNGRRRVDKGGSWVDDPQTCRGAARERKPPDERTMTNGMRVMMTASALDADRAAAEPQSAPQALTTSVATPQVVKADEAGWIKVFDGQGLDGWTQGGAAGIRLVNGAIEVNNQKLTHSLRGRDLVIRARVKKVDGANLTLDLRAGPDTRYTAFYNGANSFGIGKSIKGQFTNLKNVSARQTPGDFFLMTFRAVGKTLTLEVDGEEIARAQDGDIQSGLPGIGARGGRSLFKDIQVSTMDGKVPPAPSPASTGPVTPSAAKSSAPPKQPEPDVIALVKRYSAQQIVDLDINETFKFKMKNGSERAIRLISVQEHRDRVNKLVRRADVLVEIDSKPLDLICAPYVMPTETGGLRIQADTTSNWTQSKGFESRPVPKRVQFSVWDASDPIVDTKRFGFPIRNFRLFSHGMHCINEPNYLGWGDGDPGGNVAYHNYGYDLEGFYFSFGKRADDGEDIVSATDGEVVTADPKEADTVRVQDPLGLSWVYCHMGTLAQDIAVGASVFKGQKIGTLGNKGLSGGFNHLHFGHRGRRINTYPWLVTAYEAEHPKGLYAVARPHHLVLTGEPETFDGSNSLAFGGRKIVEWRWVFHDGQTIRQARAEKTFDKPGTYIATLWVKDDKGAEDVDFCQVRVFTQSNPERAMPHVSIMYTPTEDIKPDQPVRFFVYYKVARSGPSSIDFGDGKAIPRFSSGEHRFKTPGIHIVTVQWEAEGKPVTQKAKVVVSPQR